MGSRRFRARHRALIAAVPVLVSALDVVGQTFSWTFNGSSGNWSTASNWSPAGPPGAGDTVRFIHNDSFVRNITMNSDYATPLATLSINQTGVGATVVTQNANRFGTAGDEVIGTTGKGSFIQNGGTNSILGILALGNTTGSGAYALTGGTLNVTGAVFVAFGGTGTLLISGGSATFSNGMTLAAGADSLGTINLSGTAVLNTTGAEFIGAAGIGRLFQSAGTHTTTGSVNFGNSNSGNGTISGGTWTISSDLNVGILGLGTLTHSGGTISAATLKLGVQASGDGTFNLSNTAILNTTNVLIGDTGAGTYNQTGGSHTCTSVLTFGNASTGQGFGSMSGGTLNLTIARIGADGDGSVSHSGGVVSISTSLTLGLSVGSAGTLNISNAASLTVNSVERIGLASTGTILQSGGTHQSFGSVNFGDDVNGVGVGSISGGTWSISGNLTVGLEGFGTVLQTGGNVSNSILNIGNASTGVGTYNLFGNGSLNSGSMNVGNLGNGTFFQSQGSTNVAANLRIGNFAGSSGTATISGGTLSAGNELDVGFSGNGSLTQSGGTISSNLVTVGLTGGSNGTYAMNGGSLSTKQLNIGLNGTGTFLHSSGTIAVTSFPGNSTGLTVGFSNSSVGTFTMFNATSVLNIASSEFIGTGGIGTFNQLAGSHTIGGMLQIGTLLSGTGAGNFRLFGGSLSAGSINVLSTGTLVLGAGQITSGTINQGGVLFVGNSSQIVALVPLPGSTNFINNGLTIDTALNNSGGAAIQGAGSITLLNTASFSGWGAVQPRIINNGLLRASSGNLVLNAGSFINTGTISAGPAASLFINASSVNHTGTINITGGSIVFGASGLTNPVGRGITMTGGLLSVGNFLNQGTFNGFGQIQATILANSSTMTFTGPSQFIGDISNSASGNIIVQNDKLIVFGAGTNNGNITTANGTIIFTGGLTGFPAGGSVVAGPASGALASFYRDNSLVLNGSAAQSANITVRAAAFGGDTSVTPLLTIAGSTDNWFGKLDLADTKLIVDYAGASPVATIQNQLKAAYANGAWTGNGIGSSIAAQIAASANLHKTALGFAEASALALSTFGGQSVDTSAIVIGYTLSGDANLDGSVNTLDFQMLGNNFNGAGKFWNDGDFNYDGTINALDFNAIATNFGAALPAPALGSLIPEPELLIVIAGWSGTPRRRRRRDC